MNSPKGKRNALFILLGLTLASAPIMAEARGNKAPRISFEQLDANADGQLTQDELDAYRTSRFTDADTDGDGALSREEMLARAKTSSEDRMTRRIDRMMERMDANGDGKLSQEELTQRNERRGNMIERLDADKSGTISKAEFEQAKLHRKGRRGQSPSQDN